MASILEAQLPSETAAERTRIIARAGGSAGRALAFAALDLARLEDAAARILREGDPTNARRSELAIELGRKGAAERYAAFLDLVPALIARRGAGAARRRRSSARSTPMPRRGSWRRSRRGFRSTRPRPCSSSAASSRRSRREGLRAVAR